MWPHTLTGWPLLTARQPDDDQDVEEFDTEQDPYDDIEYWVCN